MTLQDFITKYNGQYIGDHQCGTLVRQYWIEVDQTDPPSYPDSKDYWSNPVPGYTKLTSNPQPGDIAIYNGHDAFPEGHSAVYVDGKVFEQNADPDGSPAHLFARANTYLLGYLRKGETMTQEQATELALYIRLLAFNSVEKADANAAYDVEHMLADPAYAGALAKALYSGDWQAPAYKAGHYDADVANAAQQALNKTNVETYIQKNLS